MFSVIIRGSSDDPEEVAGKLVDWLRENADKIDEDNVQVVRVPESSEGFEDILKIGDRVKVEDEGKEWLGTVVGVESLVARVRLDNGALRIPLLDKLTPLD